MKYTILINQYAAIELGLQLDVIDLTIFDYISTFMGSDKCKSMDVEGMRYYWISHALIQEQLPLIGIRTKRGIIARVNRLIEAGLIVRLDDETIGKSFYAAGPMYSRYFGFNDNGGIERTGCERNFRGGVNETSHNNNIIDNNISSSNEEDSLVDRDNNINSYLSTNNLNTVKEESVKKPKKTKKSTPTKVIDLSFVADEWADIVSEWLKYKSDRRERYKTEKGARLFYKLLLEFSDSDPSKGRKVIEQAMANNWMGIHPLKTNSTNGHKSELPARANYCSFSGE